MNFLSHYYFDRSSADPHLVLGSILPDLVKNADSRWNLQPHKFEQLMLSNEAHRSMLRGWKRHLIVDKHFHNADFFHAHTQKLKEQIRPVLAGTRVWASFLAHIALELLLDSLLITDELVDVADFYRHLEQSSRKDTQSFLEINQVQKAENFWPYFDRFLESRYLNSYRDSENVVYALNRISMRLWPEGLADTNREKLTEIMLAYRTELKPHYRQIFHEIEPHLSTN